LRVALQDKIEGEQAIGKLQQQAEAAEDAKNELLNEKELLESQI
jgi:hypothetical protein